ncbi:MAG: hypothetical protein PHV32_02125 [Eubacteriales bacterium]|nr:hypothetical protein [Eubacteriales bacterium]
MKPESKETINTYVKAIEKDLKCSKALSSIFRKTFREQLYDFAEQCAVHGESITYERLSERFGLPNEVADSFFSRSDYGELLKKEKKKTLIWKCAVFVGIVLLIVIVAVFILYIQKASGKITVTGPI